MFFAAKIERATEICLLTHPGSLCSSNVTQKSCPEDGEKRGGSELPKTSGCAQKPNFEDSGQLTFRRFFTSPAFLEHLAPHFYRFRQYLTQSTESPLRPRRRHRLPRLPLIPPLERRFELPPTEVTLASQPIAFFHSHPSIPRGRRRRGGLGRQVNC